MPVADSFIGTNILLYAVSTAPPEAQKSAAAQKLLMTANWAWSGQVAAEFINASTSARRGVPFTLPQAETWINTWLAFPLSPIDGAIVKEAIRLAGRFQISYFDAQIVAAAKTLGCRTLYTEDLNDGQDYEGVRAVNPFVGFTP